jgi:hypothetical protein
MTIPANFACCFGKGATLCSGSGGAPVNNSGTALLKSSAKAAFEGAICESTVTVVRTRGLNLGGPLVAILSKFNLLFY